MLFTAMTPSRNINCNVTYCHDALSLQQLWCYLLPWCYLTTAIVMLFTATMPSHHSNCDIYCHNDISPQQLWCYLLPWCHLPTATVTLVTAMPPSRHCNCDVIYCHTALSPQRLWGHLLHAALPREQLWHYLLQCHTLTAMAMQEILSSSTSSPPLLGAAPHSQAVLRRAMPDAAHRSAVARHLWREQVSCSQAPARGWVWS